MDNLTHELTRVVWTADGESMVAAALSLHDVPEEEGFTQEQALANARFLAHAREDVPWLCDALAAALAEAEQANERAERLRELVTDELAGPCLLTYSSRKTEAPCGTCFACRANAALAAAAQPPEEASHGMD